ncbi:hypothetical protein [Silvibacterium dinghuense]|uniref:Uncharacterized protein n=1 Tax=Silvibacterium dinghuense TaxID=1560006 RepID=A0A4Q1SJF5_9BACT|nr:hypothetical protein [Silvibacterium dinghuense]RXS97778.1 hypothetical protein ESZ00_07925 [Silvibacterium dinghuense]GGH01930.1 hypothetical protein GCM10011586_17050 [Silvibacterium dinghuense]
MTELRRTPETAELEIGAIEPEMAESIRLLRASLTNYAENQPNRPFSPEWLAPARRRERSAHRRMAFGWSLAGSLAAGALCFAMLPLSHHAAPQPVMQAHTTIPAATQPSDTALLEQVDDAIDQSVPSPLAPLTELDSWNSTTSQEQNTLARTENSHVSQ